jgi:hypothetical protein
MGPRRAGFNDRKNGGITGAGIGAGATGFRHGRVSLRKLVIWATFLTAPVPGQRCLRGGAGEPISGSARALDFVGGSDGETGDRGLGGSGGFRPPAGSGRAVGTGNAASGGDGARPFRGERGWSASRDLRALSTRTRWRMSWKPDARLCRTGGMGRLGERLRVGKRWLRPRAARRLRAVRLASRAPDLPADRSPAGAVGSTAGHLPMLRGAPRRATPSAVRAAAWRRGRSVS